MAQHALHQHAFDQHAFGRRAPRARSRHRAVAALLMSLSVATLGAGAVSLAAFTDSDASTGSWTAGTVDLAATPTTAFTASDILPGDAGAQTITVENNGTGDLRYAMTVSATDPDGDDLAGAIDVGVAAGACPAAAPAFATGTLDSIAFGSPAQGADPGDRALAAGTSEDLCVSWSFPLSAGNEFQGDATVATFTFDAEQVANNP